MRVLKIEIFDSMEWQMTAGERAALDGLLSNLKPRVAIEIGSAQGGSLARIALHSAKVDSIDIVDARTSAPAENVTVHVGDSKEILPSLFAELIEQGVNVDFVLVDGDHSFDGVKGDLELLLGSAATADTAILLHDSFNPWVRLGIEAVRPESFAKVGFCELDFVPGRMASGGEFDGQLWGGFALVLTGSLASGIGRQRDPGVSRAGDAWQTAIDAAPMLASIRAEQAGEKPPLPRRVVSRVRWSAAKWRARVRRD